MADMHTPLKPCPHCGCTDVSLLDNGDEEWFECDWCHATSGYDPDPAFEAEPISFHWNRRAPSQDAETIKALREAAGPFAKYGEILMGQKARDDALMLELFDCKITVSDFRKLFAALAGSAS